VVGGMSGRLLGRGSRAGVSVTQAGPARDHVGDVVAGELGQLMPAAGLAAHQQAQDERSLLLEEEDVTRLLVVHVATDDAERRLVATGWTGRDAGPATGARLLHEPGDVVGDGRGRPPVS